MEIFLKPRTKSLSTLLDISLIQLKIFLILDMYVLYYWWPYGDLWVCAGQCAHNVAHTNIPAPAAAHRWQVAVAWSCCLASVPITPQHQHQHQPGTAHPWWPGTSSLLSHHPGGHWHLTLDTWHGEVSTEPPVRARSEGWGLSTVIRPWRESDRV